MTVELAPGLAGRLLASARAALPEEACGALLAVRRGPQLTVTAALPLANVADDRRRGFALAPLAVLAAWRRARRAGARLGFYHSHPSGPAAPSEADRLAAWRGSLQLLVAPHAAAGERLRVWQVARDGIWRELAVRSAGDARRPDGRRRRVA